MYICTQIITNKKNNYEKLFTKTKLPNYSRAVNSCLFFNPINI